MNRGRLARYSLWQFRDFVMERGIGILIIGSLWGYVMFEPIRRALGAQWRGDQASPAWLILMQVASAVASLSVLIAMNGLISIDRKNGYYRFLFSKPVNPVAYYAQLFVVYGVGVLTAMVVLASLARIIFPAFSVVNFLIYSAVIYVAMGGIGFFLSVATRYDWLTLAAVWLGSRVLRGVYGPRGDWRSKAVELLPPVHKIDQVANSLIGTGRGDASDIVWLVGYGAVFFALGLFILRRGSLADQ